MKTSVITYIHLGWFGVINLEQAKAGSLCILYKVKMYAAMVYTTSIVEFGTKCC